LELFPGGAPQFLSSHKARAMIATIRPRDLVGKTRRRLAVDLIVELEAIDKKTKAVKTDLRELVLARGSTLMDLTGIGPSGAARLLVDVGDSHRFADRDTFASRTAPPRWTPPPQSRPGIDSPAPATAGSTQRCTSWPSSSCATAPRAAPTSTPRRQPVKRRWKRCEPSSADSPTSSTPRCSPTRNDEKRQAREGTRGRLCNPA
jgi:hypothetical protein